MPTVLVVDDEASIREVVVRTAALAGWKAEEATDAESALSALTRARFDLVCLDVRLPDHDGLWVADAIHDRYPGTPVVFLTGLEELPASKTLRRGVVGYLTKPFAIQDLLKVLLGVPQVAGDPPAAAPLRLVK